MNRMCPEMSHFFKDRHIFCLRIEIQKTCYMEWRDSSAMNTYFSSRGPTFGSQDLCLAAHNRL